MGGKAISDPGGLFARGADGQPVDGQPTHLLSRIVDGGRESREAVPASRTSGLVTEVIRAWSFKAGDRTWRRWTPIDTSARRSSWPHAGVVELVDAPDSKSGSARSAGSTPATRTTKYEAARSNPASRLTATLAGGSGLAAPMHMANAGPGVVANTLPLPQASALAKAERTASP